MKDKQSYELMNLFIYLFISISFIHIIVVKSGLKIGLQTLLLSN